MTHILPLIFIPLGLVYFSWFSFGLPGGKDNGPAWRLSWPKWLQLIWHFTTWIPFVAFGVFAFFYWGVFDQ